MLELVLEDALSFKRCIDALAALIDEAEFTVSSEGLSLKATDPSQISMVDFRLPKGAFKEFKASGTEKLGVDLNYLAQVIGRAKAKDLLELKTDDNKSHLLVGFSGRARRNFSIPLIDVSSTELPTPKIDFDAEVRVNASEIQDGLKDAALISTHLALGVDEKKFFMRANSSRGTFNNELTKENAGVKELKVKKEAQSMFPLDYLASIAKGAKPDSEISISLKNNAPVKVEYRIDKAELTYFLAPRIEEA